MFIWQLHLFPEFTNNLFKHCGFHFSLLLTFLRCYKNNISTWHLEELKCSSFTERSSNCHTLLCTTWLAYNNRQKSQQARILSPHLEINCMWRKLINKCTSWETLKHWLDGCTPALAWVHRSHRANKLIYNQIFL